MLAGDNLFELSLPDFVAWWRAKPQPASAVPLHDVGDFELATHYGIATTDGDGPRRRLRREAERPAVDARLDARSTCCRRSTSRSSTPTSTRGRAPTTPAASSAGSPGASRSTATASTASWYDIGNHSQLLEADNRLRRDRRAAGARVVQPRLSRHGSRHCSRLAWERARSAAPAAALRRLRPRREPAVRGVPRRAAADRAAALRALRRADRVAGRALPRVCGSADRVRDRPRGGRLRRRGAPVRPPWKERGLRRLAAESGAARRGVPAAARGRRPHVRPGRSRPTPRARPQPGRAARARARARCGSSRAQPLLERRAGGRQRGTLGQRAPDGARRLPRERVPRPAPSP